ncbi:glycosyltransferase family 2 protein [Hypoxylon crocopeplum]|nr:glycosyltransferase family 2 protein [Hypoxylon crocopeplum]
MLELSSTTLLNSVYDNAVPLFLGWLYLWDYIDRCEGSTLAEAYNAPFPLSEKPKYSPSDVSLIVPTVNWDEDLPTNLATWLANRPREIIFVTVDRMATQLLRTLEATPGLPEAISASGTFVGIVTVEQANKRTQLIRGIEEAKGEIVALVDDDARWTTDEVLKHLLAPFEREDIGLVGGPITSYVPKNRQHPRIITPWEVAALRIRSRRAPGMKAFFVADGSTNFTVSGLTMLLRTEIVRDSQFQFRFLNDMWSGIRQNTGDDAFITRYVLFQHQLPYHKSSSTKPKQWRLGIQMTPEAEVQTSLLRDAEFARQSKRWYRSGLRLRLTCLFYEPKFLAMRDTSYYMARKMAGGMFTPFFAVVRLILWCMLWRSFPRLAFGLLLYVLYNWFSSLYGFYRQFPYIGSKIWAAMVADNIYLVSDFYAWLTLSSESWSNRSSVGEKRVDTN